MRKKLMSALLCASLTAALAVGCGGNGGGSESGGTGDEDRQAGLKPGPEPIRHRLCRLEDQICAVQQGNGRDGNAGRAQA